MISTPILALVGTAALAGVAAQEVHNGITFEVQWTNTSDVLTTAVKDAYEDAAAEQATARLQAAIAATGIDSDCVAANNTPSGLYAFKDCIAGENPDNFYGLLADDLTEANTFWASVIANSTTDRTQWVAARTYVTGYFGAALSASEFAIWTASPFSDAEDLHSNPEHYFYNSTVTGTTQNAIIFEGWGGVLSDFGVKRTNFSVPGYSTPDFGSADYPEEWSISDDFPLAYQGIGPKILSDGTTFGVLHIAVRDVAATNSTPAGVQI
ncbi:hypothetical protein BD289DRAFT_35685 [Coniella lustricola]|uniref:Uncharacterized protein n=1 Tax=Coniella lustricola TaxID=2025994 RepID=A0A2T3A2E7_9PEZI|nr:hypothetical protein BD289DRAFT_35685 [Coniella lustricola]